MESPINPAVWRFLFHGTIATISAMSVFSLYHERSKILSSLNKEFEVLCSKQKDEDIAAAVEAVLSKLKEEAARKKDTARLSALQNGKTLLRLAALQKDGSNASTVSMVLKAIIRVFGVDADGCRKLYKLGGYRTLLTTMSEAHRQGLQDLMEETAQALCTLTRVNDADVVLETDVPKGSEGALALAQMPASVKMLRLLDPKCPISFLNALTGIFSNICALRVGALAVGRGIENRSGVSYFLRLLEHGNQSILGNCILTIRYLVRAGVGHEEISTEENVKRLAEHLTPNGDLGVTNSILNIILSMSKSKHAAAFFGILVDKSEIICSLFEIMCRASDGMLRERAELLVQLLARMPQCAASVQRLFERFRVQIAERRAKDEETRRKQLQQLRQSQMMQQMMMMESMGMGVGGGAPGGEGWMW